MEKTPVLSWKRMPTRYPITSTVLAWMAMDYYDAAGWVRGMVLTLLGLVWISVIVRAALQEQIDPLDEKPQAKPSKWQTRMKDLQDQQAAARRTTP